MKAFFTSAAIRVFGISNNLLLIFVSGRFLGIAGFGQLSAALSIFMLVGFFLTAVETREIVRIIGASKLSERWARWHLCKNVSFQNLVLLPVLLAIAIPCLIFESTRFFAPLVLALYFVRASAVLSAIQRGLGAYIFGNSEGMLIRPIATLVSLLALSQFEIHAFSPLEIATFSYFLGAVVGTLFLIFASRNLFSRPKGFALPSLKIPKANGLLLLSSIDALLINYDIFVASLIYPPEAVAELRFGLQVKMLALLPVQVFLMYNMNRLAGIFIGKQTHFQENIWASLKIMRFAAPVYVAFTYAFGLLAFHFVFQQTLSKTMLALLLTPALITLLLGPITEFYVSSRLEKSISRELKLLFAFYFLAIPVLAFLFKPVFIVYVAANSIVLSLFFIVLFAKFPLRSILSAK